MSRVQTDVAPRARPNLPETGLGMGWEPAVLMAATLILLSFGLVNLYSASAFLAQRQTLPDSYYVLRQTAGAAAGLLLDGGGLRSPTRWWRSLAWPL
jgi:cell division protein FtsW (lipid II flippase)